MALAKLNQADKAKAELDLLQKKAAACGDTCADATKLKSAVAAVQGAMGSGAPAPSAELTPPSLLFATPSQGDSAYVQAVSLINQHRYQDALDSLAEAQRAFGPHPDVLTYIGYTYRKMGQLDRAETYYQQALSVYPTHRGATEYYGELKVERGDMAGARKMLAELDRQCAFGCVEAETLRQWIQLGHDPAS
jgi:Flp pilus assembly protein TadD